MSAKKKTDFLTSVIGYILPHGSLHDEIGKEGLSNILVDAFSYGKRGNVNVEELFIELESLGSSFYAEDSLECCYLYVRAPKENLDKSKEILDKIIENFELQKDNLSKIVGSLKKKMLEIESDDREYAKMSYFNAVIGKRNPLGNKDSFLNIKIDDVNSLYQNLYKNKLSFIFQGQDNYYFNPKINNLFAKRKPIYAETKNLELIDKEYEQKVVFYGMKTSGIKDISFPIMRVAISIMSSGLTGIVVEEIREKNSAAYYATYQHYLTSNRGSSYMYAGVSEKNVDLCVNLMSKIFKSVANGEITKEQIDIAKKYSIGMLCRTFDSIEGSAFFQLKRLMTGLEIQSFNELKKQIENVTKSEVVDYFKSCTKSKPVLVINGKINKGLKSKLQEYL